MDSPGEMNDLQDQNTGNLRIRLVSYRPTRSEVSTLIKKTTVGLGTLGLLTVVIRILVFVLLGKPFP